MWALPQTCFRGRVILYSEMPAHAWPIQMWRIAESRREFGEVHCKGFDARNAERGGVRLLSCHGSRDGGGSATCKKAP
jgi:hypothetical protein